MILAKISLILNKFKIPTLLGITILLMGIGAGIALVVKFPTFSSLASPDQLPKDVVISNIKDESAVISWQTTSPQSGWVIFGQDNTDEKTVLDDRDTTTTQSRADHYVTLKKLTPKTSYQIKIVSGEKIDDTPRNFTTPSSSINLNKLQPVIGSVLIGSQPVTSGIAYLSLPGASIQSSLITNGNFIIPLAQVYQENLSNILQLDLQTTATIKIVSTDGQATATFPLILAANPIAPIRIGENLNLTPPSPTPTPLPENIYDLNSDGTINSSDYSLALKNKGKKIKAVRSELTTERTIDQQYLDELIRKVNG